MDTGATAHMFAHPDNLASFTPVSTDSRIIVGDGSTLPITHIGHTSFLSSSTPLSLRHLILLRISFLFVVSLVKILLPLNLTSLVFVSKTLEPGWYFIDVTAPTSSIRCTRLHPSPPHWFLSPLESISGTLAWVIPIPSHFVIFLGVSVSVAIRSRITLAMPIESANMFACCLLIPPPLLLFLFN